MTSRLFKIIFVLMFAPLLLSCSKQDGKMKQINEFNVPQELLEEVENIPSFWLSTIDEINQFIKTTVRKGNYEQIGVSAGGRPIYAVFYGAPRLGVGTTTFSGSQSIHDIEAYRGPDYDKTVYMGLGGVHGFELEGIVGIVNLISIFETGYDLNGEEWPDLEEMLNVIDRIILIPLMNPDGRARIPIRMETHKGHAPDAFFTHEYLNTGGNIDGDLIGWPQVKRYIPMDFSKFEFPGGYPNDNGVNIMHDDFLGEKQPETQALFDLCKKENPDIIMNMHTGVSRNNYFMTMLRPLLCESELIPIWESLYVSVHTKLTEEGLKKTRDLALEANPNIVKGGLGYNLNTALNLHCGTLCVVVESPSHGYSGVYDNGNPVEQTPEKLLRAQLVAHKAALEFLQLSGGRSQWNELVNNEK